MKNNEDKVPDITNLTTNTALSAKINDVKNKIPNVSNLVEKTDCNTKINEIENKIATDHHYENILLLKNLIN